MLNDLYGAIASIDNPSECKDFFIDLCTPSELNAMSERWHVARLIDKGVAYRAISEQTGVSTATITRVARCLHQGEQGYRKLIDKKEKNKNER